MEFFEVSWRLGVLAMAVLIWMEMRDLSHRLVEALIYRDKPEEYTKLQEQRESRDKREAAGTVVRRPRLLSHDEIPELRGYDAIKVDREKGEVALYRYDGHSHVQRIPVETYDRLRKGES